MNGTVVCFVTVPLVFRLGFRLRVLLSCAENVCKLNAPSGNTASPRPLATVEREAERAFYHVSCPWCVSGRGSLVKPDRSQAFLRVHQRA